MIAALLVRDRHGIPVDVRLADAPFDLGYYDDMWPQHAPHTVEPVRLVPDEPLSHE